MNKIIAEEKESVVPPIDPWDHLDDLNVQSDKDALGRV